MALTKQPPLKAGPLIFEESPRRVRAVAGGITLADSERAFLLWEEGKTLPVYFFPDEDVRTDLPECSASEARA